MQKLFALAKMGQLKEQQNIMNKVPDLQSGEQFCKLQMMVVLQNYQFKRMLGDQQGMQDQFKNLGWYQLLNLKS